ncbi:barstar family protein [Nocardia sp. NBC_01503]|uniref:barstar family protein n=1 Tax=Nocardia sp. NBC_01503 TaxID=2975997 RepID=UPI002E7B120D|nr:barstar family protein [Nocardia sp. NBC_01503]WTL33779.1 barstar family protein [Nocardia sp. NBC_01503]
MTEAMTLSQFLSVATVSAEAGKGAPPVLGVLPLGAAEFSGVRAQLPDDYLSRELRGRKMRTVAEVFDEFAAAFQFPYYFGQNKDAFDECLRDLDDFVGPAAGYVVVVRNAALLLADQPDEREWFGEAMIDAAAHWAGKGIALRVILQDAAPGGIDAVALRSQPTHS